MVELCKKKLLNDLIKNRRLAIEITDKMTVSMENNENKLKNGDIERNEYVKNQGCWYDIFNENLRALNDYCVKMRSLEDVEIELNDILIELKRMSGRIE